MILTPNVSSEKKSKDILTKQVGAISVMLDYTNLGNNCNS